jgi:glycosidase
MNIKLLSLSVLLTFLLFSICSQGALAKDFRKGTIYQIFTDRFCNGDPGNDDPEVSKGMFDPAKKNWHAYWGGDLQGVINKLPYIKKMGFSSIWISPVIDNVNKPTVQADGSIMAPYHGYHARNFKGIDEHIGNWKTFDALIAAAHKQGIKVMVDMPLNHTSSINHGEFGALYDGMEFMSDTENDRNKLFHHLPEIKDWNSPYQLQYYTLAWLGDLNQENSYIDTYLTNSVLKLISHGADATRLDAAKHASWGWQRSLVSKLVDKDSHFVAAEWWMSDTEDPMYRDAVKFVNKAGIGMFDFPFATGARAAFGTGKDASFRRLARIIERENEDINDCNALITFLDNHDMPRLLSLNSDRKNLHLALALLLTSRGIPSLYYGTEQYLHDDTKGGGDPYTRVWMTSFDPENSAYKLVSKLNKLRTDSEALHSGKQETVFVNDDVYVYQREFGREKAIIAINKSKEDFSLNIPEEFQFSAGSYKDSLEGALSGVDLVLNSTSSEQKHEIQLPAQSASLWMEGGDNEGAKTMVPEISAVVPAAIHGGARVTLDGVGFGESKGKVVVAGNSLVINHWSDSSVTFTAPTLSAGELSIYLERKDGARTNSRPFYVYKSRLVPVTFVVKNAPLQLKGEEIFICGEGASLGDWRTTASDAAGPMLYSEDRDYILCVPLPAGKKVRYKLFIRDRSGKVVLEEDGVHDIHVPDSGPWRHKVEWIDLPKK